MNVRVCGRYKRSPPRPPPPPEAQPRPMPRGGPDGIGPSPAAAPLVPQEYLRDGESPKCGDNKDDRGQNMGGAWASAVYTFGMPGYQDASADAHLGYYADDNKYPTIQEASDACTALGARCAGVVQEADVFTVRAGTTPAPSATGQTSWLKGCGDGYCETRANAVLPGFAGGDHTAYPTKAAAEEACDKAGTLCGGVTREKRVYTCRQAELPKREGEITFLKK